jgi:hypothetical protein
MMARKRAALAQLADSWSAPRRIAKGVTAPSSMQTNVTAAYAYSP